MNITLQTLSPLPIAYIRRVGAYGAGNAQTMEQLKQWVSSKHLMNDNTVIFGIAHDDPQRTSPENCRYDACVQLVGGNAVTDVDVQQGEIAGGSYALFLIAHTAEAMAQAWSELFQKLSELHFSFDATRPILERYATQQVSQHLCEILVPVNE